MISKKRLKQMKHNKAKCYIYSLAYLTNRTVDEDAVLKKLLEDATIDEVLETLAKLVEDKEKQVFNTE